MYNPRNITGCLKKNFMNKNPGKKVLMAVCNYFNPDNRVFRAANTLQQAGFKVVVLAYHTQELKEEELYGHGFVLKRLKNITFIIPCRQLRNYIIHMIWKYKAKSFARHFHPAYVHCHDHNTLFLGNYCKKKFDSVVIYDNHEYFQDLNYLHRYPLFVRKIIAEYERKALRKFVDEMIVVSPGIAEAYQPLFKKQINIVRNIPDTSCFKIDNVRIPHEVKLFLDEQKKAGRKLLLYLGTNTQKGRGMDFTFRLVSSLPDNYALVIFGAKNEEELFFLKQKATEAGIINRFGAFKSLPIEALFELSNYFYMGLSLIEPVYFSYLHSLPNKLFEYMAMGLPVISSDIDDQAITVTENNVGIIVPFEVLKAKDLIVNSASKVFNKEMKSLFTWEKEKQNLLAVYSILK